MPADMKSVFSDRVSQIGYDADTSELVVIWKNNGRRSIYSGVPSDIADEVMRAPSIGSALNADIIGQFNHRYG